MALLEALLPVIFDSGFDGDFVCTEEPLADESVDEVPESVVEVVSVLCVLSVEPVPAVASVVPAELVEFAVPEVPVPPVVFEVELADEEVVFSEEFARSRTS